MEVDVDQERGDVRVGRVVAAIDSGDAVNPDGIRNQTEGGIVQSISWTLFEAVTWDRERITSRDWARYPMIRCLPMHSSPIYEPKGAPAITIVTRSTFECTRVR